MSLTAHATNRSATLPAKFKIKAYCPIVFRDIRSRFIEDSKCFLVSCVVFRSCRLL